MVITTSEYIQIVSAGIYSIALFYTIVTFRRTKRLDQISLLNNIFSDLRELDRELASIPSGPQYDDARSQWYSRIFNSMNWLSFMVNEKVISDKKMIDHIKLVIIQYYEDELLKNETIDERNSNSYPEFKKTLSNNQKVGIMAEILVYVGEIERKRLKYIFFLNIHYQFFCKICNYFYGSKWIYIPPFTNV